jgi:hypothetical protein
LSSPHTASHPTSFNPTNPGSDKKYFDFQDRQDYLSEHDYVDFEDRQDGLPLTLLLILQSSNPTNPGSDKKLF